MDTMDGDARTPKARWAWVLLIPIVGLALSLLVSWFVGPAGLFLFLPFVFPPIVLGRRRTDRSSPPPAACPACGWSTFDAELAFCPRDGNRLAPPKAYPR